MRARGFSGRGARWWVKHSAASTNYSSVERRRAQRWGFLPETVERFQITEANRASFVSARDYAFVQPLNGKYGKWVRDRISALAVFSPFSHLFEPVHYHFLLRDDDLLVIPISSAAQEFEPSLAGVVAFLRDTPGSPTTPWEATEDDSEPERHRSPGLRIRTSAFDSTIDLGLSFAENSLFLDDQPLSESDLRELLLEEARHHSLVLVEPTGPDVQLSRQFPHASSDIRIIMVNSSGTSPQVGEAFVVVDEETTDGDTHRLFSRIDPLTGHFAGARALDGHRLAKYTDAPSSGAPITGVVTDWSGVVEALTSLCRFAPQLEFLEFRLVVSSDGPRITRISPAPDYLEYCGPYPFSTTTTNFIRDRFARKSRQSRDLPTRVRRWLHNAKLWSRRKFAQALYPAGLVRYQSVRWLADMARDFREPNGIPVRTKIWAYRHGMLSYRIPQYGITPANWQNYISDLEYRWLRHINNKYKYWLEDKISIKYVGAEFGECFPAYFYFTDTRGDHNTFIPMMDCPAELGASAQDVLHLAREVGTLALKPDEGSHGDGFFRLDCRDGSYFLNDAPASEQEIFAILTDSKNRYLVTEFITPHPDIARIYPHSVNTLRMIVFKRDGVTPQIGNAYLRIGTSASGFVDNTSSGGMFADVDLETGRFGNARILRDGLVQDQPVHPDTGVLIEGVLPHWEQAKEQVLRIAQSIKQLEYFGFDVAITEDGIKIPEINRFPDYPRIEKLTPDTIEYLLHKLTQKKNRTNYWKSRRKPLDLPRRNLPQHGEEGTLQ
ncbi:MAG: sugar-transfer associated ATP-grasp domain-containing protein [Ancrocorticia sp.]